MDDTGGGETSGDIGGATKCAEYTVLIGPGYVDEAQLQWTPIGLALLSAALSVSAAPSDNLVSVGYSASPK